MKKLKIVFEEKHFTTNSIVVVVVHVKQEVKILLAPPGIQTTNCKVCRFFCNLKLNNSFKLFHLFLFRIKTTNYFASNYFIKSYVSDCLFG